jgi:AraC family transcriptional activator FtrA
MTITVKNVPREVLARKRALFHRKVAALASDDLGTFELGIVVEVFGLPRPEMTEWYSFQVCGLGRGPFRAVGGLRILPSMGLEGLSRAGTIVIPGWRTDEEPPQELVASLIRAHRRGARLVSICSGVFVLAATGLLDGRRATTHWRYTEKLARKYPRILIEPDVLYVDENEILTSAGSAAGIDLCLHIVRRDFGSRVANEVARRLVISPHREGGQAQFIERPVGDEDNPWLSTLLEWAQRHLHEELRLERLASASRMSKRTLSRRFAEATGTSPANWIAGLRVSRAKELLETTAFSIEEIAEKCGFGSAPVLRHHFRERLRISPIAYRSRFRLAIPKDIRVGRIRAQVRGSGGN